MFDINATYLIFIASFLVFIMLLNEIMLKPVGRVLEKRAEKIRNDIEDGKSARVQAEEVLDGYHQQLFKTKSEAQAIINEALEKANYHRNTEMAKIKEEGRRRVDAAKAEIAVERSSLMEELTKQESQLVKTIMEKLLGEPVVVNLEHDKVRRALEEAC
jgi:F-type H+-transporting ATPase subunit b